MRSKDEKVKSKIVLIDIRSSHNVGSMFRTADAAGIDEVILVGYTPAPLDRFGRPNKELAKVALGAEKSVLWKQFASGHAALKYLKEDGFFIVALEQAKDSINYKLVRPKKKTAFVFGNEVDGLKRHLLKKCDQVAFIEMKGHKESLNVSVALGVALFRILDL